MIKRLSIFLALFAMCTVTLAQTPEERAKQADKVLASIHQLDIMNQILPLLLTKEQLKKILPAIEKARKEVTEAQVSEYETLKKFGAEVDKAVTDAFEKSQVPSRELLGKANKLFAAMGIKRAAIAEDNSENVIKVLRATLQPGQIKAATNALEPSMIDPSLDTKKMSDDAKLKFFVKMILLDPAAYDILTRLEKQPDKN